MKQSPEGKSMYLCLVGRHSQYQSDHKFRLNTGHLKAHGIWDIVLKLWNRCWQNVEWEVLLMCMKTSIVAPLY